MSALEQGKKAPNFKMMNDSGQEISLDTFKGKKLVLYFYPKDDTPGCTVEAKDFSAQIGEFHKRNCEVVGVSKDNQASHCKFIDKHKLSIQLATDEDGVTCELYKVWVEKSMYGKKYMGIDRSTFLIDESGCIIKIWRKVKVDGHVKEVLEAISA